MELPGYYFDEERNRYFRVTQDHRVDLNKRQKKNDNTSDDELKNNNNKRLKINNKNIRKYGEYQEFYDSCISMNRIHDYFMVEENLLHYWIPDCICKSRIFTYFGIKMILYGSLIENNLCKIEAYFYKSGLIKEVFRIELNEEYRSFQLCKNINVDNNVYSIVTSKGIIVINVINDDEGIDIIGVEWCYIRDIKDIKDINIIKYFSGDMLIAMSNKKILLYKFDNNAFNNIYSKCISKFDISSESSSDITTFCISKVTNDMSEYNVKMLIGLRNAMCIQLELIIIDTFKCQWNVISNKKIPKLKSILSIEPIYDRIEEYYINGIIIDENIVGSYKYDNKIETGDNLIMKRINNSINKLDNQRNKIFDNSNNNECLIIGSILDNYFEMFNEDRIMFFDYNKYCNILRKRRIIFEIDSVKLYACQMNKPIYPQGESNISYLMIAVNHNNHILVTTMKL